MSERARNEVIRWFEGLAVAFREQLRRDCAIPAASRSHVGFPVAFRPWGFRMYDSICDDQRYVVAIAMDYGSEIAGVVSAKNRGLGGLNSWLFLIRLCRPGSF